MVKRGVYNQLKLNTKGRRLQRADFEMEHRTEFILGCDLASEEAGNSTGSDPKDKS